MSAHKQTTAIVVGGGLAGLTAAYRLTTAGWQVKLLETNDYPGGRAASTQKQGYIIDTGATGVGDCYTEYLDLINELEISDQLVFSSAINGTLRDGRIYEVDGNRPLLSGALSTLFSWRSKLILPRVFMDLKRMGSKMNFQDVSVGHEWDDESAETYSLRRLNQEILDYFVDPILRALVVARAKYISKLELMNALNGLFSTKMVATLGGISLLPRTLASHTNVQYHSPVSQVIDKGNCVEVTYNDAQGNRNTDTVDACVVATLLPQAMSIFPQCEPWVKPLNDALHYIPGICVHLGYSKQTHSKALMVLVSSKELPEITLLWLDHNKTNDRAPAGHSLFYLYYDDAVADQASIRSDQQLIDQCNGIIEKLYPELRDTLDMSLVSRWDAAVPSPETGIYKRMHQVRQNLDDNDNGRVQLAGDYLSCVGQNTAVHYGNEAARKLIMSVDK